MSDDSNWQQQVESPQRGSVSANVWAKRGYDATEAPPSDGEEPNDDHDESENPGSKMGIPPTFQK